MTAKKQEYEFDSEELDEIHAWVDGFRFSREKKNIRRDFSDGILIGEIVSSVDPKLVDLKPTFSRMGFRFSEEDVDGVINSKPLAIEHVLRILRVKIEMYIKQKHERRDQEQPMPAKSPEPPKLSPQTTRQVALDLPTIKKRGQSQNAKARGSLRVNLRPRRCPERWNSASSQPRVRLELGQPQKPAKKEQRRQGSQARLA